MTIKVILFCLFLYVCLVWVGAYYLYTGAEAQHFGLQWTAIGLISILVIIIGARIFLSLSAIGDGGFVSFVKPKRVAAGSRAVLPVSSCPQPALTFRQPPGFPALRSR